MSRIVVKNLPKKITEEKIREIFGERGLLTDVQLKYTSEGTFRRFAFLGYQSEKEAQEAIKHFNNTCIQTNTIVVEACAALGDLAKPKSWSKYSTDSSAYKKLHPEQNLDELKKSKDTNKKSEKKLNKDDKKLAILEKYKDDPQFEEYLQVHAPQEIELLNNLRTKKDSDDEDDSSDSGVSEPTNDINENEEKVDINKSKQLKKEKQKKDLKLFNLKVKDLPYKCKKKDIKDFFKPNIPFSIRIPRNIKGIAFVGFKNERQMKKGLLKDRSILGGRSISVTRHIGPESKGDKEDLKKVKWKSQEEKLKNEEDIGESGRIFVRNLAYITTEDDVQNLFAKYGPITEVNLPIDSTSRKMKGFGIITFLLPEHAVNAYAELDGSILHGRMLHLLPGKAKDVPETEEEGTTSYKTQKVKKQKAQAGSAHNWNSLFMGHDAVAEAMAESYGTSKKMVLDPHGQSNAAVRLALGETQIVTETRKYLEAEGVILDAFNEGSIKRSKTIILVKNLPVNTEIVELRRVFEKYGIVGRVVLPPKGITAIVEFLEPSEARKAFSSLAYSQFKSVPLLLEWAPENSLHAKSLSKNKKKQTTTNENNEDYNEQHGVDNTPELKQEEITNNDVEEEIIEPEPETTLFVKNLNFKTTDDDLKSHFETCGKLYSAMVTMKKDMNKPGNKLSMGYGFVRYFLKSSTDKALKQLQGSSLDGKTLELKRSERTLANDVVTTRKVARKGKPTGSKLLVRNVPFQAKKEELFELFKTFGEIKALRLPKKMTVGETTHRGFAFVDYFTSSDAKKAFEALSQSTHLYGRRLVLEWATTEEEVDDIRKRTASHFHNEEAPKSKKSVFNID